ncbi:MAG TPA: hypothetical protein VMD91_16425 [Candidatus Sulfotelmatobacter sp.]|nr:hypothetical protein [Candidatus Sulfotelmatobacter sp.]
MAKRRGVAAPDTSCVPVPQRDGGFAVELRFRLDPGAPPDRVDALQRALRLRPESITVQFAYEPRARGLRISGLEVGEVFTYATRVADAIREIGDLVRDEPPPARTPARSVEDRARPAVTIETTEQRWAYEPPGSFLVEPPPPTRVERARASARALVARMTGRKPRADDAG